MLNTGHFNITKVRSGSFYAPRKCLSSLPTLVAGKRRIADYSDDSYVTLQEITLKLLENALYGKDIENKEGRLKKTI